MCSQNLAIGDGKDHVSAKERFYWLELKDVAVAPDYSPKLAVPGRMQFVLKKDSPDTKLGLTLFGVGDALICANLAVESAAYQAGLRDGDCVLTINGVECKEKIVRKFLNIRDEMLQWRRSKPPEAMSTCGSTSSFARTWSKS